MLDETLAMRLRGAYILMRRRFQSVFEPLGATADQFVVLTLLTEEQGVTQQQLARRSFSDPNTMTVMLNLLEKNALIERRPHQSDKRARCVYLTRKGKALQQRLARAGQSTAAALQGACGGGQIETLISGLRGIAVVMDQNGKKVRK